MEKFVIVFSYMYDEEDRVTATTKPIEAESEQEAVEKLVDQFESYEGTKIDIIKVKTV
jgi:ribosomal protein L20A (L18A)